MLCIVDIANFNYYVVGKAKAVEALLIAYNINFISVKTCVVPDTPTGSLWDIGRFINTIRDIKNEEDGNSTSSVDKS